MEPSATLVATDKWPVAMFAILFLLGVLIGVAGYRAFLQGVLATEAVATSESARTKTIVEDVGASDAPQVRKTYLDNNQVTYELKAPSFTLALEYFYGFSVFESIQTGSTVVILSTTIENPEVDVSALESELDGIIEINALQIRVVSNDYCIYEWCFLETKSTYTTPNMEWEYLGSSKYCDVGHCAEYRHIYKRSEGDKTIYVATYYPVHEEVELSGFTTEATTKKAFDSIVFKKD
jgi:hypothetical protein